MLLLGMLTACTLDRQIPLPVAPTSAASSAVPTAPAGAGDGWVTLLPGVARRTFIPGGNVFAQITALRIDPAQVMFRVHYRPGQPLRLAEWQAALPGTLAFVNANFFSPAFEIEGLLVSDGVVYGRAYQTRGGTFGILNGSVVLRSNLTTPYTGEAFEQAVQAFPMLVENGVQAYTSDAPDRFTRRTVIAQGDDGHIWLMATPLTGLTLLELSAFLASEDLSIITAMNLDGGGSTLFYSAADAFTIASLDPVPAVLAVYPR